MHNKNSPNLTSARNRRLEVSVRGPEGISLLKKLPTIMKPAYFLFLSLSVFFRLSAQTGPNSPSTASNNTTTGTNAWLNPDNIGTSDNAYATVSVTGNTNYLFAQNFGFAISGSDNVDGIQLDIEKSELAPAAAAILDNWSNGLTKTISAGTNRCLIVIAAIENGNGYREISSMTYGGQAMTQVQEIAAGASTGFSDRLEVWMLPESGIILASGTTITPTYAAATLQENVEFFTSAVFQNIDQSSPVSASVTTASNSSANPHQLGSPLSTIPDAICVTAVICGNNTSPASSSGGTNTYTINSSFTEGTDIYTANPSFATSGISVETATKLCTTTGSEQPSFTFAGTVNRAAMLGITLQRARALDNSVYLLIAGTPTGTNKAFSSTTWPSSDAYVTYGGPTDLWGTSLSYANVNHTAFGAALSASRNNGNLRVDHFRMTVYTTSTLPIELVEFNAVQSGNEVDVTWVTATEHNNDYFEVERTADGISFETLGMVDASGNSSFAHSYRFIDTHPLEGVAYYRMRQVDFNGMTSSSPFAAVNFISKTGLTVYPNPSVEGVFTFMQEDDQSVNEVAVFSADMKFIKKETIVPGEKAIISIADQPDGIYFLVYDENGNRRVSKVQKLSREQ